tara:strand:- start:258 stop:677 length:420 start_codon:yes stop_codon:yes gene_type:complete
MKTKYTEGGVHIINLVDGVGQESEFGDTISVKYTGYLENGDVFDSTENRDAPFTFPLGMGRVIKGWDEAFLGLRVGTKCTLIIPPEMGYGDKGQGPIPSNSILLFDVEVIKIAKQVKENMKKTFSEKVKKVNKQIGRTV